MTKAQRKTLAVGVGLALFTLLVPGGVALWWELSNTTNGATFSETVWVVWAHQPWVIWLLSHMVAAPVWFLAGHFVAQSRKVYDEIRGESAGMRITTIRTMDGGQTVIKEGPCTVCGARR